LRSSRWVMRVLRSGSMSNVEDCLHRHRLAGAALPSVERRQEGPTLMVGQPLDDRVAGRVRGVAVRRRSVISTPSTEGTGVDAGCLCRGGTIPSSKERSARRAGRPDPTPTRVGGQRLPGNAEDDAQRASCGKG
jgi:hypothetical protein